MAGRAGSTLRCCGSISVLASFLPSSCSLPRSCVSPSVTFRFQAVANFDAAFVVMAAGMLLTLPSGLVAGLYRARGLYGRAVWLQSWGTVVGQVAQLVAIVRPEACWLSPSSMSLRKC